MSASLNISCEVVTGVLGAMIAVEDGLRQKCSASDGFRLVKGIDEHWGVHRVAHLVTKNPPRTGIHDAHQVEPPGLALRMGHITLLS
jgi:hypothetical protein